MKLLIQIIYETLITNSFTDGRKASFALLSSPSRLSREKQAIAWCFFAFLIVAWKWALVNNQGEEFGSLKRQNSFQISLK